MPCDWGKAPSFMRGSVWTAHLAPNFYRSQHYTHWKPIKPMATGPTRLQTQAQPLASMWAFTAVIPPRLCAKWICKNIHFPVFPLKSSIDIESCYHNVLLLTPCGRGVPALIKNCCFVCYHPRRFMNASLLAGKAIFLSSWDLGLEFFGFSVFTCIVIMFSGVLFWGICCIFYSTTSLKFSSSFTIRAKRIFIGIEFIYIYGCHTKPIHI